MSRQSHRKGPCSSQSSNREAMNRTRSAGKPRRAAIASRSGEMSTPINEAPLEASSSVNNPVPQPTSSTFMPGARLAPRPIRPARRRRAIARPACPTPTRPLLRSQRGSGHVRSRGGRGHQIPLGNRPGLDDHHPVRVVSSALHEDPSFSNPRKARYNRANHLNKRQGRTRANCRSLCQPRPLCIAAPSL